MWRRSWKQKSLIPAREQAEAKLCFTSLMRSALARRKTYGVAGAFAARNRARRIIAA
jgi:hypothetical protein